VLCGLQRLLKAGNTNLPLAASIKIQARAKGMLQRKKDRQKRAALDTKQEQPAADTQQATPRAPAPAAVTAAPPPEPPMSLESLPKGMLPSIGDT